MTERMANNEQMKDISLKDILKIFLEGFARLFKRVILDNFWMKLISILIAIFLWVNVQGTIPKEETFHVPLKISLPQDYTTTGDIPSFINANLSGKRGQIEKIRSKTLLYDISIIDVVDGPLTIFLNSYPITNLPEGINIRWLHPSQLTLNIEKKVKKRVGIKPRFIGKLKEGYEIGKVKLTPDHVTIVGARSLLENLSELKTQFIDVTGVKNEMEGRYKLDLSNLNISVVEGGDVKVYFEIAKTRKEKKRIDSYNVVEDNDDQ